MFYNIISMIRCHFGIGVEYIWVVFAFNEWGIVLGCNSSRNHVWRSTEHGWSAELTHIWIVTNVVMVVAIGFCLFVGRCDFIELHNRCFCLKVKFLYCNSRNLFFILRIYHLDGLTIFRSVEKFLVFNINKVVYTNLFFNTDERDSICMLSNKIKG